jgi:hypothetical protein
MRRDEYFNAFGRQPAANQRGTPPLLRQTYRLTVVCHGADSSTVEAELKRLFAEHRLMLRSLLRDQPSFAYVRISALLASSICERAAVVRIVNLLASNPSIRRLQWETVPNG